MKICDLQIIYNEREDWFNDWFEKYKIRVSYFRKLIEDNKKWSEDDLFWLIQAQDNNIANNGQWGTIYNTDKNPEFDKITAKWESDLLPIIKEIVKNNDITIDQFQNFRNIFVSCCKKNKILAANRVLAAFLPNVLTTTVNENDFYYVEDHLKKEFPDYRPPQHTWSESNKYFIEYCNNKIQFEHPWMSSIFNWVLREYFKHEEDLNLNNQKQMEKYTNLLEYNHNLIFTGAPGTGKTYLAKQIAQQMIFGEVKEKMTPEEEKQFNEQCGFVQFHPSYDYTDFVEGLRPIQDDNGYAGFERKEGVFKEFCKKAIASQKTNSVDNFNEVWDKLVNLLNENDLIDVPFISNKNKTFRVELNEYGTGLANRTYQNDDYQKGEWIKGQSKFFSKEQLYNIYRGMSGIPSGGHDNYRKAVVNYMKENLGLKDYQIGAITDNKVPFVFIVDEINRGEISKIFGELFFSIDPGYRGVEGKVKTQYQNLIEEDDEFYDGFYVPENVYIIGTMNDIDRSVESMDFAFRRRFAFKEVKSEERLEMLDGLKWKDDAERWMKNLNCEIEKIEGLSSAYHIGPAYFLKLENYNGDFDQLWENHLEGLLLEYMRGMTDVPEKMKKLAIAFGYPKKEKDE